MRTLTTERLVLRPWADEDADFLLDLEGRWEVVRYLDASPAPMTSRAQALASITRRRAISGHAVHGIWLVALADGTPVGNLLLKPISLSAGEVGATDVEIGWHLHPDAWGHGYATEAAAAVLAVAFASGLGRVLAVTHPENLASQALCRRLGMRHLGQSRRYMNTLCEVFEAKKGE